MNGTRPERQPLARVAMAVPAPVEWALSLGGRAAGGLLAAAIAFDQSFERTRALAIVAALVALVSLLPLPGTVSRRLTWLGAGVLFFTGALLAHLPLGALMIACGAVAALGAALLDGHEHRSPGVPSFFAAFGLTSLAVVAIILSVEG